MNSKILLPHQNQIVDTPQQSWSFYVTCLAVVGVLGILNIAISVQSMYARVATGQSSNSLKVQELTLDIQKLQASLAEQQSLNSVKTQAAAAGFQQLQASSLQYWQAPTNTSAVAQR